MNIDLKRDKEKLTVAIEGKLDTNTSPEVATIVENNLADVTSLVFDFEKLTHISSAGFRIVISAQKTMNKRGGEMKIINAGENIKDIFIVTGLDEVLNIV